MEINETFRWRSNLARTAKYTRTIKTEIMQATRPTNASWWSRKVLSMEANTDSGELLLCDTESITYEE